ncbi:MAG: methionine synthase [Sporomusa sp.]
MPLYHPRLEIIDTDETRRYAGLSGKVDFAPELLNEACTLAQLLAIPKGVWQTYVYDQDAHTILSPTPVILTADSIIKHLNGAYEIAVMAVTIGLALEQEVSNLFSKNQYTLGLLLDAAGTTAVEATCDAVSSVIAGQAARAGLTAGRRFSPGYSGWPIDVQPEILALATGAAIELSVTDTKMLVPRKSVTAVIGLYPYSQVLRLPHQQALACNKCGQPTCQARKEPARQ